MKYLYITLNYKGFNKSIVFILMWPNLSIIYSICISKVRLNQYIIYSSSYLKLNFTPLLVFCIILCISIVYTISIIDNFRKHVKNLIKAEKKLYFKYEINGNIKLINFIKEAD